MRVEKQADNTTAWVGFTTSRRAGESIPTLVVILHTYLFVETPLDEDGETS